MATYAIGDVQGCFKQLQQLLAHIHFNPQQDILWFTGDLVSRGPQSLEVLRFIKSLGEQHNTILGNHDLHLLAIAHGIKTIARTDTLHAVLAAHDCDELLHWLQQRPLLHYDATLDYVMTHAGLAPAWTLAQARALAQEVATALRSNPKLFLKNMYGNEPLQWNDNLLGAERLRCITNYFTRMRFCYANGGLDLTYKGDIEHKPNELIPWFQVKNRANATLKIIFGHWAALGGKTNIPYIYPLDTGCVWGNCLTAKRLEDERRFSVKCIQM